MAPQLGTTAEVDPGRAATPGAVGAELLAMYDWNSSSELKISLCLMFPSTPVS